MLYLVGCFLVGLAMGIGIDRLWTKTSINKYERRLEVLEHYHWGLVVLMLTRILQFVSGLTFSFAGMASIFILFEAIQEHPYAIKSDHQLPSTIIGILLLAVLFLVWVMP